MNLFTPTGPRSPSLAERIEPDDRDCWIWTGPCTRDGYGTVTWQGKSRLVHRLVYTLLVGPIPANLTIDHLCLVHPCVNPDHLEPVTLKENIRRGLGRRTKRRNLPNFKERTHCVNGHLFTVQTRYRTRDGRTSFCRTCKNQRDRERRRRRSTQRLSGGDPTNAPS